MKFTKLMALALVLVMLVSAFAACGGETDTEAGTDAETNAPDTQPEVTEPEVTEPEVTEPEPTETDAPCTHSRTRPLDRVEPTCTEDGFLKEICRNCELEITTVLPKAHKEGALLSEDGKYTKYTCTVCFEYRVVDANGAAVADASGIKFPFFNTDFTDVDGFANITAGFGDVKLGENEYASVVVNDSEKNTYVNVPSGTSNIAPNGFFEIVDIQSAMAKADFSVKFAVQFSESPKEEIGLLTWTIGGTEYKLLTVDPFGKIKVLGATEIAALTDKGWDKIQVDFDFQTNDIYVYFNSEIFAKGNLGASVSGKTESVLKFFEGASQFEAYIDDLSITFIDEAKTDACIHKYEVKNTVAATCEGEGKVDYECSKCKATKSETLRKLGHRLGEQTVVEATCSAEGSSTATCTVCNKVVATVIEKLAHSYEWKIDAEGKISQACKNCTVSVSYATKGDALIDINGDKPIAESVNSKIVVGGVDGSDFAIVEDALEGKIIDVNTRLWLDDSSDKVIMNLPYFVVSFRFTVPENSLTFEAGKNVQESVFTFLAGHSGATKVGSSVDYNFVVRYIKDDAGSHIAANNNLNGNYITTVPGTWYEATIIADAGHYYVFIDGEYIGSRTRANLNDSKYGNAITIRIGDGKGTAMFDDISVYEIEAK